MVRELSLLLVTLPPSKLCAPSSPFQQHPWRAGRKSVRIASLSSLFYFAIFLHSTKRIFPDSGVPYPLVSTVGFAIFSLFALREQRRCSPRRAPLTSDD